MTYILTQWLITLGVYYRPCIQVNIVGSIVSCLAAHIHSTLSTTWLSWTYIVGVSRPLFIVTKGKSGSLMEWTFFESINMSPYTNRKTELNSRLLVWCELTLFPLGSVHTQCPHFVYYRTSYVILKAHKLMWNVIQFIFEQVWVKIKHLSGLFDHNFSCCVVYRQVSVKLVEIIRFPTEIETMVTTT